MPAQEGNPFDLLPRLKTDTEEPNLEVYEEEAINANPFDLVEPPKDYAPNVSTSIPRSPSAPVEEVRPSLENRTPSSENRRLILGLILFSLVYLTMLTTAFRSFLSRAYRAFLNGNMMNQVFRESQAGKKFPYVFLYTIFFVNLSLFIFFLLKRMPIEITFVKNDFQLFMGLLGGVVILFLLKHFVLWFLATFFPLKKEAETYSFAIMIFSVMLGYALIPANLLMAYGAEEIATISMYLMFGLLVLVYLFRALRGVLIANKYLVYNTFHFLLYICTIELAPVLIIAKLVL